MHIKVLKFLARVFICPLKLVDAEEISDDVLECMTSLEDASTRSILIVQVIDNSNKYDVETSRFTSHYAMNFYALGHDELDERLLLSGPIIFKNQIKEGDVFDEQGRSLKQPDQFDVLTDLKTFESRTDFDQGVSCYKSESWDFIYKEALAINQRFTEYRHKISRVEVNEKTVYASLFTLCTFDIAEGQKRKGVLLQVKYDTTHKQWLLLMRLMQMTQSQQEKFEWVPLSYASSQASNSIGHKHYHVSSDQYRGFVSLDFFKGLDNTYATGVKLRSKHLHFVSHEHHMMQLNKYLNYHVFRMPDEQRVETLADLNALDEESKVSNVVSKSAVRSECSYVEVGKPQPQYRSAAPCSKCNYTKEGISTLTCSECNQSWHVQCLEFGEYQQKTGTIEKNWRCPTCIRCTHCHSMVQNQKLMLLCRFCNSPFHYDCLDASQKAQIPQYVQEFDSKKGRDRKSIAQGKDTKEQLISLLQVDYKCG
jgi:hypothetical protein